MPFDSATRYALEYQGRRMRAALHPVDGNAPDRKEAALIQRRVDDILDRRPQIHSIAPDGEIIWDSQSPFVMQQVESIVQNATGQAEVAIPARALPHGDGYPLDYDPDDDGGDPPLGAGGIGLLDRP